ncbi:MAG TPA: MATE family efflux transporter [Sandaracinaceae bacterium LLY-WYZ-13_1]|nr:MATE family efflux transporter [Sandaracinaceae bacterium LLY-WYZ-13_1]
MTADLDTGSAAARVAGLAVPITLAMGLQTCFAVVDLIFVGTLGPVALAGLAVGLQVAYGIYAVGQVLGVPALADVGHAFGARDRASTRRAVGTYLAAAAVGGGATSALLLLGAEPIAAALAPDAPSRAAAVSYLGPLAPTALTQAVVLVASGALRAAGDAKTPLLVLVISVGANIALDALFIFGWGPVPSFGLPGAAAATLVAQGLGASMLLVALFRRPALRPARPRFDARFRRGVLGTGVPAAVQFALFAALLLVLLVALQPAGPAWTGGVAAGFRLLQQGIVPFIAIGTAGAAVAAQASGRGRDARVWEALRAALAGGLAGGALLGLALHLFGGALARALLGDDASAGPCGRFLEDAAWCFPALAFATAATFVLQGLHRPWPPLLAAGTRLLAFAAAAGWLGASPGELVAAFVLTLWLEAIQSGGWLTARGLAARPLARSGARPS